jgi:glycosyltransferase involved in cell wall biosynthesis
MIMKLPSPKISIVVAVLNGEKYLDRCLLSVITQVWSNKELIVIDGGSTDRSLEIINARSSEINYWESSTDGGIYQAWTKALKHLDGDWICFLGSDDYFFSNDVLNRLTPSLKLATDRDIRLVYGRIASIKKNGEIISYLGEPWDKHTSLKNHEMPPHPGMMHHKNIFKEHGCFNESFQIAADYELLLRELKVREGYFVSNLTVAAVQYGGISSNIKHLKRLILEDIKARRLNRLKFISIRDIKYYIKLLINNLYY